MKPTDLGFFLRGSSVFIFLAVAGQKYKHIRPLKLSECGSGSKNLLSGSGPYYTSTLPFFKLQPFLSYYLSIVYFIGSEHTNVNMYKNIFLKLWVRISVKSVNFCLFHRARVWTQESHADPDPKY